MKNIFLMLSWLTGCTCIQTAERPAIRCAQEHIETTVEYGIGGTPIGGQQFGHFGPQIGTKHVCDKYETYTQTYCVKHRWFWEK